MSAMSGRYVIAQVWLDEVHGPFVAEVLEDYRWNGWACPRFSREQAQAIAAAASDYGDWSWDGEVLRCVLSELQVGTDDNGERFREAWAPDAQGKYAVGSMSWTWDSAHHFEVDDGGISTVGSCSCGAVFVGSGARVEACYLDHLAAE